MQFALPPIHESKFIGFCDRYPSHELPPGLFSKFDNANAEANTMSKRPGNTPTAASLGARAILGGSTFEPAGGTKVQVVCLDGGANAQLYKWTGSGAWSAIGSANLTAGAQMNFVQASNTLFGFNGFEVVSYDGTTVTKNPASVPLGKYAVWFHNYLFVSGVTATPNRLLWSNLGVPGTFSGTDFIDINANDGDFLTGMAPFNDELYNFKNNSMWSISGWSGTTFTTTTIAGQNTNSRIAGLGTPSHQSIVTVGRELFYLSFLGGVPHFRKLGISSFGKVWDQGIVSYDIENTMKGLNLSQLSKCAGTFDGKKIRWAVPNSSSSTNNLVLAFRPDITLLSPLASDPMSPHHSWVTHSGITPSQYWHSTVSGRDKIYFGDATTAGFVYEADTSVFTDNGVAVVMDIRTRDIAPDPNHKYKFVYNYFKYKTGSAGMLNINARIDQAANFANQEILSLQGNSPGLGPTGNFKLGVSQLGGSATTRHRTILGHMTGSMLGLEYKESTANSCDIYDFDVYVVRKGLRSS